MIDKPLGLAEGESSPLEEATPTSLEDIFNKDPLKLTTQDLTKVVEYFRGARETFLRDDAVKIKNKGQPKEDMKPELTIDDLDL